MIGIDDVRAAARGLEGVANRTPVLTSRTLDGMVGAAVHVKAECFQRGGAFKFRGAYTKIASLDDDARSRGVVAYSSGNHAQAVAIAAQLLGTRATILMPADAPTAKVDATRGYGAKIVEYDRWTENRQEIGAELAAEHGLELVKPYDDPLVMPGRHALRALEDVPELDPRRARRRRRAGSPAADRGQRDCGDPAMSASSWRPATTRAARSPQTARTRRVLRTIADWLQAAELAS
jgi:threonine dehydratase